MTYSTSDVHEDVPAARAGASSGVATRIRYGVLAAIFLVTTLNYADRATLSVTGPAMRTEFGFGAVQMGYMHVASTLLVRGRGPITVEPLAIQTFC